LIVCEDVLGWWDDRLALRAAGAEVIDRALWRWPFSPGTDYLILRDRGALSERLAGRR
jgi:hypothetical protein